MRIISNLMGIDTLRNKKLNANSLKSSFEKLSSGFDINRAADNASGLAISEKMRSQIREMDMCQTNVQQGISLADTADSALGEVNDLLKRAREICVQASNGTYQEDDRSALNKELTHIMGEIDRIASSTHYNNISLFTDKSGGFDWNQLGNEIKDFYEVIKPVVGSSEFGKWERISDKPFDMAIPPELATATIQFGANIDATDISTFDKKTFTVVGTKYYLHDKKNGANPPKDITDAGMRVVAFDSRTTSDTVDILLDSMASAMSDYRGAFKCELTADKKGMKITAPARDFTQTLNNMANFPGNTTTRTVAKGDGTWANNSTVYSKDGANPLGPVFATDPNNDRKVLANMTGSSTAITPVDTPLTETEWKDLVQNKFHLSSGSGSNATITFADNSTATGNVIALQKGDGTYKSRADIWSDISTIAANLTPKITINVDGAGKITAFGTATETAGDTFFSFYEERFFVPVETTTNYPGTALGGVSVTNVSLGDSEFPAEAVVHFPSNMASIETPTSMVVNGRTITLFNSDKIRGTLRQNYGSYIDVKGKSQDDIMRSISGIFPSNSDVEVTREGNDLRFAYRQPGDRTTSASGQAVAHVSFETLPSKESNKVLMNNTCNAERTFEMPLKFPLNAAGDVDIDALDKTGFAVGSRKFEFGTAAAGTSTDTSVTYIQLTDPANLETIRAALQNKTGFTATVGGSPADTITLTKKPVTANTLYSVKNSAYITNGLVGEDGLFSDSDLTVSATFSGGTKVNQPQTVIDFSGIDNTNKGSLLGKGFRITCASCPSEYINIFFRNDNTENPIPPFFDMVDGNGVNRVIKNMVVDLKDINSGEDIVKDIVQKLTPKLDHFTEVAVGNPADQLVVLDKRNGDYKDLGGVLRRAEVLTGVKTNFTYDVALGVPGENLGIQGRDNGVMIYVGSKPNHQYIPIDLPIFNSELLQLRDPDIDVTTRNSANEGIAKVDLADKSISAARGVIGAAKNRLENAFSSLSNGAIQLTASESQIRDLDVAKETMNLARRQILDQATTALLAQANQIPSSVLELLK